jgi:hypothetical protein
VRDTGGECEPDERAGCKSNALAQRGNRIQNRSGRSRQRPAVERSRRRRRSAAAEEARAVGFPFDRPGQPAIDRQHMKRPGLCFVGGARPATEQQTRALMIVLGFDEQLRKRRMREVVVGSGQHDLGVAGDFDFARPITAIGDRQPANFDVVFR